MAANDRNLPGFFQGTGMPDPGWWEALWPDPAKVLSDTGVKPGMDVIDLCSGNGWFTLQIAEQAHHVFAVDIDAVLLKAARIRLTEHGLTNVTYLDADAYQVAEIVPRKVDHVFLANAFHGVPDRARLAKAVHAALRPKGIFAVVSWYARPREETTVLGEPRGPATELRMTPEETVAAIEPHGFKTQKIAVVSPYHYGAVFVWT